MKTALLWLALLISGAANAGSNVLVDELSLSTVQRNGVSYRRAITLTEFNPPAEVNGYQVIAFHRETLYDCKSKLVILVWATTYLADKTSVHTTIESKPSRVVPKSIVDHEMTMVCSLSEDRFKKPADPKGSKTTTRMVKL